jgi:hypothetical protein
MKPNTTFADFANLTADCAVRLYGDKSKEVDAIRHGWKVVGVAVVDGKPAKKTVAKARVRRHT